MRFIHFCAIGSVRIRKRSGRIASTTISATSSGSLIGPAAVAREGRVGSPSIGVRTPSGASSDTRMPLSWYVIDEPLGEADDRVLGDGVGGLPWLVRMPAIDAVCSR